MSDSPSQGTVWQRDFCASVDPGDEQLTSFSVFASFNCLAQGRWRAWLLLLSFWLRCSFLGWLGRASYCTFPSVSTLIEAIPLS